MIAEQKMKMPICNFPTMWQAVLFRNIGMLPLWKIAKVLKTDENTLLSEAKSPAALVSPKVLEYLRARGEF